MNDPVNSPSHYLSHPSGIECIEISQHHTSCIGQAIQYIWRAGEKDGNTMIQDYKKAVWFIQTEIKRLEKLAK